MQASNLHLQQASKLLSNLKSLLQSFRNNFGEIWKAVTDEACVLGIDAPVIPRTRRAPRRLDSGPDGHSFTTPEEFYRQTFIALIDTALGGIEGRFSSDTWTFLAEVESALVSQPVTTAVISDFYGSDLNGDRLDLHVSMFHDLMRQQGKTVTSLGDIVDILKADATIRVLLPELTTAVRLILTIPVTTCTAERSFSGLRRLKTYLRSTMSQSRLNHVAVLNVHRELLDKTDIDAVMNDFIDRCPVRRNTFGK